jgi:hypothetical protein
LFDDACRRTHAQPAGKGTAEIPKRQKFRSISCICKQGGLIMSAPHARSTTHARTASHEILRKALANVKMPAQEAVLSGDAAALLRDIQAAIKSGKTSSPDLAKKLQRMTANKEALDQQILDLIHNRVNEPSLIAVLASLYFPTDVPPPLGLTDHSYFEALANSDAPSHASASAATGQVGAYAMLTPANFPTTPVTASGGVAVWLDMRQGYGKLNRVTFGAEVIWQAGMTGQGDYGWASNTSGIVSVAGSIDLTVLVFDERSQAFGSYSGAPPYSYAPFSPVLNARPVDSFSQSYKGVSKPQQQFLLEGGNIYAFAVELEMQITNSFGGYHAGEPAPTPPANVG